MTREGIILIALAAVALGAAGPTPERVLAQRVEAAQGFNVPAPVVEDLKAVSRRGDRAEVGRVLAELTKLLEGGNDEVRARAAAAMGFMGAPARPGVPALRAAMIRQACSYSPQDPGTRDSRGAIALAIVRITGVPRRSTTPAADCNQWKAEEKALTQAQLAK